SRSDDTDNMAEKYSQSLKHADCLLFLSPRPDDFTYNISTGRTGGVDFHSKSSNPWDNSGKGTTRKDFRRHRRSGSCQIQNPSDSVTGSTAKIEKTLQFHY
ncbi:hypothetical protein PENTCL1PPCAC_27483, partial [Pristionchus entomophagus]